MQVGLQYDKGMLGILRLQQK